MISHFRNWRKKGRNKQRRGNLLCVERLEDRRLFALPAVYNPAQIRHAYGFDQIPGLGSYDSAGTGQTIAIIAAFDDPNIRADVRHFDEQFAIGGASGDSSNTNFLTVENQDGGFALPRPNKEWAGEIALDVEWAHAIAPGAGILLVEANSYSDYPTAVLFAEKQPTVSVVSMSFGSSEFANELDLDGIFTTPVIYNAATPFRHQGVVFVAGSGDTDHTSPLLYPALSPNVLAVGGTILPPDASHNPDRSAEAAWTGSGGGISAIEPQPAYEEPVVSQSPTNRTGPDVAYNADPSTGFWVYDSYQEKGWIVVGGTSAGAPQWAALVAIADQQRANANEVTLDGPSQLLPAIYQIYQDDPSAFQDIVNGASTTDGTSSGPVHAAAGVGYDLATGLGTPNAQNLVPDLVVRFQTPASHVIYWTGDAGKDKAGDYNWDDPLNWSTDDPTVVNVPGNILPGPEDNVVIDLDGQNITHSDNTYDIIGSLTVTGNNVTLNLVGGTLDLSGSGNGKFDVPGLDLLGYGSVHLNGGVLANADVQKDTTITVFGTTPQIADTGFGKIDGGQLNGKIQVLGSADYPLDQSVFSTLEIVGTWTNNGTIAVDGGATLRLGDTLDASLNDPTAASDAWVNNGTIKTDSDVVELGGWLSYAPNLKNLATLDLSTDTVALIGTLDNSPADNAFVGGGGVLNLVAGVSSKTGSWFLDDGRIDGGALFGAPLVASTGGGTLDALTNSGSVEISNAVTVTFQGQGWQNLGTITASGGATVNLYGGWVNSGDITIDATSTVGLGSPIDIDPTTAAAANYIWTSSGGLSIAGGATVNLGGVLTTDTFNGLTGQIGTGVHLTGTLDNSSADNTVSKGTLELSVGTGSLYLSGGRIYRGTLSTNSNDNLVATANALDANGNPAASGGGTLDGLVLQGTLDMTQYAQAFADVINGLTLEGTIELGGASGTSNNASLLFGRPGDNLAEMIDGTGSIQFGQDDHGDFLNNQSNETLTLGPSITVVGGLHSTIFSASAAIDNQGTIKEDTSGGKLEVYGPVTLQADNRELAANGVANYSNGTFTGGAWEVSNGGVLWLSLVNITTNVAGISISGAGSAIFSDSGVTDALAGFTTNDAGGSFSVGNGYTFAARSDFNNAGRITVASGGAFTTKTANYLQTTGKTTVDGALDAAQVHLNGGLLDGTGSISAHVTNAAALAPGDAPGTLTVQGDYTQTETGTLNIVLGSTTQFGQLAVTGNVALDGVLNVSLAIGFQPAVGDSFQIMTFHQVSGDFAVMNGLDLGNGGLLVPAYSNTDLTLSVAPNQGIARTIYWTGDAGDHNWDNPGNWSNDDPLINNMPQSLLPGPADNVVIDLGGQTINHSAAHYDSISSLIITGQNVTLNLLARTLDLSGGGGRGNFQVDQPGDVVNLQGGVLKSADVTSKTVITAGSSGGTLDGIQLDGALDMTRHDGAKAVILGGMTLNGIITLGGANAAAYLYIGSQSESLGEALTGTGTIQFGQGSPSDYLYNAGAHTLTIGRGITIAAGTSSFIAAASAGSGPMDNQGRIVESTSGGQLTINLDGWVNNGLIAVSNGASATLEGHGWSNSAAGRITVTDATLNLYGNWTNYGTITVDPSTVNIGNAVVVAPHDPSASNFFWSNQGTLTIGAGSTVNLGGVFTTDRFESLAGQLQASGQSLDNLTGTLDNSAADNPVTGGVLALNATTGPLYLDGGQIFQGAITTGGSDHLLATRTLGTLNGVELDGTLELSGGALVDVVNNMTLNGEILMGDGGGTLEFGVPLPANDNNHQPVSFDKTPQTMAGTGVILLGQSGQLLSQILGLLTIGPKITIDGGQNGTISSNSGAIDNRGRIEEKSSGGRLSISAPGWLNDGMIEVADSATATLTVPDFRFTGQITLTTFGNTTFLNPQTSRQVPGWSNHGSVTVDSTSTVYLGGDQPNIPFSDLSTYYWTNPGAVSIADGAAIYLTGVITTDTFNGLAADLQANGQSLAHDTVNLGGILDNSAAANPVSSGLLALGAATGPLYLTGGGTIYHGRITTTGSEDLVATDGSLDGVTLDGTLDISRAGATVVITHGLTLNGLIELGGPSGATGPATLDFFDSASQLLDGSGVIQFGQDQGVDILENISSNTVTIGPNITIQCGLNSVIQGTAFGNPSFVFQGTIKEDTSGGRLTIYAAGVHAWVNDGAIEISNGATATLQGFGWTNSAAGRIAATGATLNLYENWINLGAIAVNPATLNLGFQAINTAPAQASPDDFWSNPATIKIAVGSTVNLGGVFTTDALNRLVADLQANGQSLAADTVSLTGTLDNSVAHNPVSGGILALDAATGPLRLAGGRIYQGIITTSGSNDLVATALFPSGASYRTYTFEDGGVLDGVELDGILDMTQFYYANVDVVNNLTLNGTIELGGAAGTDHFAYLYFGTGLLFSNFNPVRDTTPETISGTGIIQFGADHVTGSVSAPLPPSNDYTSAGLVRAKDTLYDSISAPFTIGPNVQLEGGLSSRIDIYGTSLGTIDNLGTIEDKTSGGNFLVLNPFNSNLANYAAGTLTGGTWTVANGGTLELRGVKLSTNAADISVSGAGSHIYSDASGTDALAGFTTDSVAGSFTVGQGYTFAAPGNFSNAGRVTVDEGGTFSTVTGNYTQSNSGTLNIDLGGTNQLGQLAITDNANLDGTLNVSLSNGFMPSLGDSFKIMLFASHGGDFAVKSGLVLGNGNFLTPVYESGGLTLTVTNRQLNGSVVALSGAHGSASVYGQEVSLSATVTPASPSAVSPTGSLQFRIDGSNFGSPMALSDGSASITIAKLTAGNHALTAVYSGDSNFLGISGSLNGGFVVTPAPLIITADDMSMVNGSTSLPVLTAHYAGFVNGDSPADLTTQPTFSTTATLNSPPGSYAITASGASDPNYTISYVAGTLTLTPDVISFDRAEFTVARAGGSVTIAVGRTGSAGGVTVDYSTSDGTARAGIDYVASAGTLTFAAGESSKTFSISILNDSLATGDKTVKLTLSNATGGAVLDASGSGPAPVGLAGPTSLVTISSDGLSSGNDSSFDSLSRLDMSADGRYVVFASNASNLVANDASHATNVFVRDLVLGTTTLVSVNRTGTGSGNNVSIDPRISADGRFVTFVSQAADLVPGLSGNGSMHLYVRDLRNGTTVIVDVSSAGFPSQGLALPPWYAFSPNGRYVAFESQDTGLVPNASVRGFNVFVRDLVTHTTSLVSVNKEGTAAGKGSSHIDGFNVFSADGRFVVFDSTASDLVANTPTGSNDNVFVRDLVAGTTTLVSVNSAGTSAGNSQSAFESISANGRYVAFLSDASDLVPNDTNNKADYFVRDLLSGTTSLVTATPTGDVSASPGHRLGLGYYVAPVISGDGRLVLFSSDASDLVATPSAFPGEFNVFVRDLVARTTTLVSVNQAGTAAGNSNSSPSNSAAIFGNGFDGRWSISTDDRFVTFSSYATDLAPGDAHDPNQAISDLFVRDLLTKTTTLASAHQAVSSRDLGAGAAVSSADGATIAFLSPDDDLANKDSNSAADVFVAHLTAKPSSVTQFGLAGPIGLVSVKSDGSSSGNGSSGASSDATSRSSISADGRYVAFTSNAGNLVSNDTNGYPDVFVRDLLLGTTTLVSVNHTVAGSGNGPSQDPQISADGRFILFKSSATDLVPNVAPDHLAHLYVRDLQLNTTQLADVSSAGTPSAGIDNIEGSGSLSPNGRYVAFVSLDPSLVPNDFNQTFDVFVRDLVTHATSLVSVNTNGGTSSSGFRDSSTGGPNVFSADGRFLLFGSDASDLVSGLVKRDGTSYDLFVRDLVLGTTTLVSVNSAGTGTGDQGSFGGSISADGRMVAFASNANDLTANDVNEKTDVFVRDLVAGTTVLATVTPGGTSSTVPRVNESTYLNYTLSADGRFIVMSTADSDLAAGFSSDPMVESSNVYVRDLQSGITRLVSVNAAGTGVGNNQSTIDNLGERNISDDGRFVLFQSIATDLAPGDPRAPNQVLTDVFVRDMLTGTTTLVSPHLAVSTHDDGAQFPVTSADGATIVFISADDDLVADDSNKTTDIFVAHLQAQGSAVLTISAKQQIPSGQISGTVFLDYNADGVRQPGEPSLAGRTVFLDTNDNGRLDSGESSVTTDYSGAYAFAGLSPGTYNVREAFPPDHGTVHTASPATGQGIIVTNGAIITGSDLGLVFISQVVPVKVTPAIYPAAATDTETAFVEGLYHSMLGRDADPAGRSAWLQLLRSGVSRSSVSGAIWDSPEHRGMELDNYYAAFLGRAADAAGRAAWIQYFLSGADETDVIVGFLTSPEYQALHAGAAAFLNGLYFDVLGRTADAAGLANWEQVFQDGASRNTIARAFIDSEESHRRAVDGFYAALLHRGGEPVGEENWVSHLRNGLAWKSFAVGFLASPEYFGNAQDNVRFASTAMS